MAFTWRLFGNASTNTSRNSFSTKTNDTIRNSVSAFTDISAPIKIQLGLNYNIFYFHGTLLLF